MFQTEYHVPRSHGGQYELNKTQRYRIKSGEAGEVIQKWTAEASALIWLHHSYWLGLYFVTLPLCFYISHIYVPIKYLCLVSNSEWWYWWDQKLVSVAIGFHCQLNYIESPGKTRVSMSDCLGHIGLWRAILTKLFDVRGPSLLWVQHPFLFGVLNYTKVEVNRGSMHAFILSLPLTLEAVSLVLASSSSWGIILGKLLTLSLGFYLKRKLPLIKNNNCGRSAEYCPWLCDWLVVYSCILKVEELWRHHSRGWRVLQLQLDLDRALSIAWGEGPVIFMIWSVISLKNDLKFFSYPCSLLGTHGSHVYSSHSAFLREAIRL